MRKISPLLHIPIAIGIILGSWIIVHVMAAFGIFIAIGYAMFSAFCAERSICFACHVVGTGHRCPFCKEIIYSETPKHPKRLGSIVFNTLGILFFTILSMGIVYGESKLIENSGILAPQKTVSFNIPEKGTYSIGEIFPMEIKLAGIKTAINVVQTDFTYDPELLEIVSISTQNSLATVFLQKDFNNTLGYSRITAGIPAPGYSKTEGTFAKVYFKAKQAGFAQVAFLPTSMVLANDGKGTSVLQNFGEASYVIKPEELTEEQQAEQEQLFTENVLGAETSNGGTDSTGDKCKIDASSSDDKVLGVSDTNVSDSPTKEQTSQTSIWATLWNWINSIDHFIEKIALWIFNW